VELDFWYIWDLDEPGTGMNAIVDRFNQENDWGIKVTPHDQGLTLDPLEYIEAAFDEGLVPHVMVSDASVIAEWYQEGLTMNLASFMSDPAAGISLKEQNAYYPGLFDESLIEEGVRPGIPFSQSIQVIYYNQTWAADLGFSRPPTTTNELIEQVCKAAELEIENQEDAGGIILYPDAANIAGWIFAYGGELHPSDDAYQFTTSEIIKVARAWQRLIRDQCGYMVSQYPNPMAREIELSMFNSRKALMVMNSARFLEQIHIHNDQLSRSDDWTMLPFLGPYGEKSVPAEIQTIVIFKTSPKEQLAAWLFLKYLSSPEIQAEWVKYSYLYPTRSDSMEYLNGFRTENPDWAKALDLLKYSKTQPIDLSWDIVRQALGDAFELLLSEELPNPIRVLGELENIAKELKDYAEE
jgi:multiple sugar transport system substrate-binding protein/sn-glycerol 3-phosphate transport system substrate-binding protein